MAGKKGMTQPTQNQATRDAKALANIENWMDQILDGHITCVKCRKDFEAKELQPSAVALLKARYDKLRPSLSAVEQTNVNEGETLTEEQILLKLQSLILGNRQMVEAILAASKKTPDQAQDCGVNTESAPQHTDNGVIEHPITPVTH